MELSKEQILKADDLQIKKVDVPEWKGYVFVRTLTAEESYEYNSNLLDKDGNVKEGRNLIVEYCSFIMCNSKGERIFTFDDVTKLAKKNTKALLKVYEAGKKLNGDEIEELEKNLETTRSEDSVSD